MLIASIVLAVTMCISVSSRYHCVLLHFRQHFVRVFWQVALAFRCVP